MEARQRGGLFCVGRASKWFLGNFNLLQDEPGIAQRAERYANRFHLFGKNRAAETQNEDAAQQSFNHIFVVWTLGSGLFVSGAWGCWGGWRSLGLFYLRAQQLLRARGVHVLLGNKVHACIYSLWNLFALRRFERGLYAFIAHAERILHDQCCDVTVG